MNVLLVSEPGVDGVFRYVEGLAEFLIARGLSVHLAYSDVRSGDSLPKFVERVRRSGGRALNLHVGNQPRPGDARALLALAGFVRTVKPDVIHCHSAKAGVLARALPLAGVFGIPVLYQPHAYIGMRARRGRMDAIYDLVERILGLRGITVNCSYDEQKYALHHLRIPPSRNRTIPNGVDTSRFVPATPAGRLALRTAFGIPQDAVVLGMMCRNSYQKDPATLYRAFLRAADEHPSLVLFHVGHGGLDDELERLVEGSPHANRVIRIRYLDTPTDFYQAVDGFALPSRYEGLSLSLLEALSANLPLIISDAPGNGDILHHPLSHAWRAPVGDVEAFTRAIDAWASECLSAEPAPCNHREIAREHYDHGRVFARVVALYRHVVPAPAATPNASPSYARA